MADYIREYSAGEFITSSLSIYRGNFLTLFLVCILPISPVYLFTIYLQYSAPEDYTIGIVSYVLEQAVTFLIVAPTTVTVSDICLGNQPTLVRSYTRLKNIIGRLGLAYLLLNGIVFVGIMLLIIPGVIASVMLMFMMTAVILERRSPIEALRRSIRLGKEFYLRNFGVLLLMGILVGLAIMAFAFAFGIMAGFIAPSLIEPPLPELIGGVFGLLIAPMFYIIVVLLYYDLRVRKENYDAAALAQEMMG
jgi:hypothetical protein